MSNENYYDYYTSTAEAGQALLDEYRGSIDVKRNTVLNKLLKDTGAVAWVEQSDMQGGTHLSELAFAKDSPVLEQSHIKQEYSSQFEGNPVVVARGKGNVKSGKALNALIVSANTELKGLPTFINWVIQRFEAHRSCFGASILNTYGGMIDDSNDPRFVLAIPNRVGEENDNRSEVPDMTVHGFTKLTYGQFYDITHSADQKEAS